MKKSSRRKFIAHSAILGTGGMIMSNSFNSAFASINTDETICKITFEQQPLQYAYDALEQAIDAETMDLHYNKHAAAYCKNLSDAAIVESVDKKQPLEDLLKNISKYSVKMRNNAGGHFNHELFWKSLSPTPSEPSNKLLDAIKKDFTSLDEFKKQFTDIAKSRFGSGWAWLYLDADSKLKVGATPNQDNPLMDLPVQNGVAPIKGTPIFGLDVWEHAYYLKYQNKRADYIDNFWKILNWKFVSKRYKQLS